MKIALLNTKAEEDFKNTLFPNEKVIGILRRHPVYFTRKMMFVAFFFVFILLIDMFKTSIAEYTNINFNHTHLFWIWVVIIPLLVYYSIYSWIDYRYNTIIATNLRVVVFKFHCIFSDETDIFSINQINEICWSRKGIFQWIFTYGYFFIDVKTRDQNNIHFYYTADTGSLTEDIVKAHAETTFKGLQPK